MSIDHIIANQSPSRDWFNFPEEVPTLSVAGIQLVCREGMPRYDFINQEWVERRQEDGAAYNCAAYECVDFCIGMSLAAKIMVRRTATFNPSECKS